MFRKAYTNPKSFLTFFFFYTIISTFLYLSTTSGWAGLFFIYGAVILYLPLLILYWILTATLLAKNKGLIYIFPTILYSMIFFQLLSLFLNSGDNGDNFGANYFYEKVLIALGIYNPNTFLFIHNNNYGQFLFFYLIVFIIFNILVIFAYTRTMHSKPTTNFVNQNMTTNNAQTVTENNVQVRDANQ